MFSRCRTRRAWTADSWTVGILKSEDEGLEKMCWGDGRNDRAEVVLASKAPERIVISCILIVIVYRI